MQCLKDPVLGSGALGRKTPRKSLKPPTLHPPPSGRKIVPSDPKGSDHLSPGMPQIPRLDPFPRTATLVYKRLIKCFASPPPPIQAETGTLCLCVSDACSQRQRLVSGRPLIVRGCSEKVKITFPFWAAPLISPSLSRRDFLCLDN